jgi:hypothetical protein
MELIILLATFYHHLLRSMTPQFLASYLMANGFSFHRLLASRTMALQSMMQFHQPRCWPMVAERHPYKPTRLNVPMPPGPFLMKRLALSLNVLLRVLLPTRLQKSIFQWTQPMSKVQDFWSDQIDNLILYLTIVDLSTKHFMSYQRGMSTQSKVLRMKQSNSIHVSHHNRK